MLLMISGVVRTNNSQIKKITDDFVIALQWVLYIKYYTCIPTIHTDTYYGLKFRSYSESDIFLRFMKNV